MGPDARRTVATLTRLRQEVAEDRQAMQERAAEITEAKPLIEERAWASHAALALHAWYTALEAAFERVARTLDGDVPTGDRWHRDLLSQVTIDVPGVRPAVVSREVLPDLLELLAFRHFFRHGYAVSIDPAKLRIEMERMQHIAPTIETGLAGLDTHLAESIRSSL